MPTPVTGDLGVITRRFPVLQRSSNGAVKLRCIDDFAESQVNSTTLVTRRIRMGRISDLSYVLKKLVKKFGSLHLAKSDFKAAYRCCPISPEHSDLSSFLVSSPEGVVHCCQQWAMPFGAVGAVYSWDRVGHCLTHLDGTALIAGLEIRRRPLLGRSR